MNKEQSLALWRQGRDAWNAWAKAMLDRRAEMERDGTWASHRDIYVRERSRNGATDRWMQQAAADFEGQVFNEKTSFAGFLFPGLATFEEAAFRRGTWFDRAMFSGDAVFIGTTFSGDVVFDNAAFSGNARFENAIFIGNAGFTSATFGHVCFICSRFSEFTWFIRATINRTVLFTNSRFDGSVWFDEAAFSGNAWFDDAVFGADAKFPRVTFSADASFLRTMFGGLASFTGATFSGKALFEAATFDGDAWFNRLMFSESARFHGAKFKAAGRFAQASFKAYTTFYQGQFCGLADFSAVQVERTFTMQGAAFAEVPDFIQAHFAEAPRLDNVSIPEVGGVARLFLPMLRGVDPNPDLSSRYRALKRLAIQAHDQARELDYSANELKAQRGHPDSPLLCPLNLLRKDKDGRRLPVWPGGMHGTMRFWFGLGYEVLSNFGRSIALPLFWWVLATATFARAYLGQAISADRCASGEGTPWSAALGLSIRKALPFAGIASSEKLNQIYACLYGIHGESARLAVLPDRFTPVIPDAVDYLGMVQLVFSILLLFLFLLAVRSHFRIR